MTHGIKRKVGRRGVGVLRGPRRLRKLKKHQMSSNELV